MQHGEPGHGPGQRDVEPVQAAGLGRGDPARLDHDDVVELQALDQRDGHHHQAAAGQPYGADNARSLTRLVESLEAAALVSDSEPDPGDLAAVRDLGPHAPVFHAAPDGTLRATLVP